MLDLTLRQLRAVAAVHRNGRIVSAAKALGLSQPAVTLQIRDAESAAGTKLFDRTSQGLRPTAAGRAVVEAALAVEERLEAMRDELEAIRGGRRGGLRLGVVSTAKYFAPRVMAAFLESNPGIDMTLWVGNRAETIDTLATHAVDIALMGRPPRGIPIRAALFGDHPLVVVAPPGHPLAGQRAIPVRRIAEEKFLVREVGSGTRISLEMLFSTIPGRVDHIGVEMGSNETIKQAVIAGLGIALISAHTIEQEVETGRLVVLDVEGLPIVRQWFAVSRSDREVSPTMLLFEDFLRREAGRFLPEVPGVSRLIAAAE